MRVWPVRLPSALDCSTRRRWVPAGAVPGGQNSNRWKGYTVAESPSSPRPLRARALALPQPFSGPTSDPWCADRAVRASVAGVKRGDAATGGVCERRTHHGRLLRRESKPPLARHTTRRVPPCRRFPGRPWTTIPPTLRELLRRWRPRLGIDPADRLRFARARPGRGVRGVRHRAAGSPAPHQRRAPARCRAVRLPACGRGHRSAARAHFRWYYEEGTRIVIHGLQPPRGGRPVTAGPGPG